jgi:prepilin-type N-terminal cleavage/methylation domain-containing protein
MVGRRSNGFTLLEVMIASSLMALLMLALVTGMRIATRAYERGKAQIKQADAGEQRFALLIRQVSSLAPVEVDSDFPDLPGRIAILEATPSRLSFLSTYGASAGSRSGLLLVEYAVLENSAGKASVVLHETAARSDRWLLARLIARVEKHPDTGKPKIIFRKFTPGKDDVALLSNLDRAQFEYRDPSPRRGEPDWVPQWEGTGDAPFPEAVQLVCERGGLKLTYIIPVPAHFLPQ